MIAGRSIIKRFLYIDRCCEGYNWTDPQEDEEFYGIPAGWYGPGSLPCIEIHRNGKLVFAINCNSVECIEFE